MHTSLSRRLTANVWMVGICRHQLGQKLGYVYPCYDFMKCLPVPYGSVTCQTPPTGDRRQCNVGTTTPGPRNTVLGPRSSLTTDHGPLSMDPGLSFDKNYDPLPIDHDLLTFIKRYSDHETLISNHGHVTDILIVTEYLKDATSAPSGVTYEVRIKLQSNR